MKARILPLTLLVLALLLPWATGFSGYILYLLGQVGVNALAALGLNLLMGLAGQISLGHAGFVAIGAYVSVLLEMRVGLSFLPSLLAALIACALLGAVIGLPALRLSGFYLAVVTMAFGLVTTQVITNLDSLTGGPHGIRNIPWPKIASLTVESDLAMYFLILAFLLLGLWVIKISAEVAPVGLSKRYGTTSSLLRPLAFMWPATNSSPLFAALFTLAFPAYFMPIRCAILTRMISVFSSPYRTWP
jgi:ABC-type branched-subunit amino acid transport system permease subunit